MTQITDHSTKCEQIYFNFKLNATVIDENLSNISIYLGIFLRRFAVPYDYFSDRRDSRIHPIHAESPDTIFGCPRISSRFKVLI